MATITNTCLPHYTITNTWHISYSLRLTLSPRSIWWSVETIERLSSEHSSLSHSPSYTVVVSDACKSRYEPLYTHHPSIGGRPKFSRLALIFALDVASNALFRLITPIKPAMIVPKQVNVGQLGLAIHKQRPRVLCVASLSVFERFLSRKNPTVYDTTS